MTSDDQRAVKQMHPLGHSLNVHQRRQRLRERVTTRAQISAVMAYFAQIYFGHKGPPAYDRSF